MAGEKQDKRTNHLRSYIAKLEQLIKPDKNNVLTLEDYLTNSQQAYELGMDDAGEFVRLGAIIARIIEIKQLLKAKGISEQTDDYLKRYREGVIEGMARGLLEGRGIRTNDEFYQEIFPEVHKYCQDFINAELALLE